MHVVARQSGSWMQSDAIWLATVIGSANAARRYHLSDCASG